MSITVEYRRHPMAGAVEVRQLPAGLTVQGIVETVSEGVAFDVDLVRVDAEGVPHSWPVRPEVFARVRPVPGTIVRVRPRVRAAALPFLATWLSSATGLSILASQVIVGLAVSAVALVGSYFLFGADVASSDRKSDKQNPTISGLQNTYATRGQPVPLVLGRHRMAPVRVATGYNILIGQTVRRRERMTFGPGPIALHDLKIGETPVHRFEGVRIQLRNVDEAETLANYPQLANLDCEFLDDSQFMTLYSRKIFEDVDGARLEVGSPEIRDTPEGTAAANVQFYFAGLVELDNDDGSRLERSAQIGVYYRPVSGGTWVTHSENTYTGKTTSVMRFGERIEFPSPGAWMIKVERLSPDSALSRISDDSYLESIQSELEGTMPSPSGVAEIVLHIKATEQLSGALDPVNAVVQQMGQVWNGSSFGPPEPIRHPADIYVELLRADYRRRGLFNGKIDLDGIRAWKNAWPNWRCDMVVVSDRQLGDLVRDVLATGLATPTHVDGKHSLIFDRADQPAVQVFTPRTTADYSGQWQAPPEVHAFRLVFPSELAAWTDDEIVIYANGYDENSATEIEVLEPPGLVRAKGDNIKRLAQWGYYHLAQVKNRTTKVSFTCDLDHLVCNRGDPVIFLSDALRNTLATGRITQVTRGGGDVTTITLDDAPPALDGVQAHVMARSSNGALQYVTATQTAGVWVVVPGSGVRVNPAGAFNHNQIAEGDLAVVYEYATEPQKWLVSEIAPEFGERARVTLTEATTVPLDNMNRPLPEYDPKVIPVGDITRADYSITYDEGQMFVNLRWYTLDPGSSNSFRLIVEDSAGEEVLGVQTSQQFWRLPVQSVFPESLTARIQARLQTGAWGEIYTTTISTAAQFDAPPPTKDFQGRVMGEVLYLTWAQAAPNVEKHLIRYSPELTGATWATAIPIVPSVQGEQVPVAAQNGTYLIKPLTYQQVEATEARAVVIRSANVALNAVATVSLAPNFDGTGDNGLTVLGGNLVFASDGNFYDIDNLFEVENLFSWGRENLTATFDLAEEFDLGVVDTVRISAALNVYGYFASFNFYDIANLYTVPNIFGDADGEWSVTLQISTTDDDPAGTPTWSDWEDLVVGDYRARAFRFRILFAVSDEQVIVEVAALDITIDMPDRIEKAADIVVPITGVTVTFSPPFRAVPAIVVDAQGLPAGGRSVKSAVTPSGFALDFVDSLGNPVAGTADYTAVGYGREGT